MKEPASKVAATKAASSESRSGLVLQRSCACGQHITGGGECEECKKKTMLMQRHPIAGSTESTAIPSIVREVIQSPGRPLESGTRNLMERRFAHDFSQVRIHVDAKAALSAEQVNARAYTIGKDIVFGTGEYSGQNQSSRHLLAHELTHVVQQATGGVGPDSEKTAAAAANQVSAGKNVEPSSLGSPVTIQRQVKENSGTTAGEPSAEPPVDKFDFDKTEIPPQHLARLGSLRMKLLTSPNASVVLTGHTDSVGSEKYNLELGRRRAMAVRNFLSEKGGLDATRIQIASRGEAEPAAGQSPERKDPDKGERNAKNRRVEIEIKGLSSDRPTVTPPTQRPTPDKPILPGPGGPMIKELCIVYPDLCNPPDPKRLPDDFWKPIPPAKRPQKSPLDVINEAIVDPVVREVTKGLPKSVRDKILDLAHDGVEKGLTSAASSAAAAAGVNSQGQQAIEKAVDAALKYKGQQPGQENTK